MNAIRPRRPVVVGVDGSEASHAAVDWAVGEAVARHTWLRVVHAFIWPLFPHVPLGPSPYGPPDGGLRAMAERIVDESVKRATNDVPGLSVDGELVTGAAEPVLLTESRNAQVVIVASRGLGGFTGLLVGSVSGHLTAHAACPVVVIRPAYAKRGGGSSEPVTCVVGVDDPTTADHILEFAFAEASRLGAGLTAVHCVEPVTALGGVSIDERGDVTAVRRLLGAAATSWQQKYPEVRAETRVISGAPARTLVDLSRGAVLLVVGSHGGGGFRGMLLGSVSQQVLHHAAAPVAVVRGVGSSGKHGPEPR
jgi:nucleotide-binding universal stress UspA family protein